MFKTLILTLSVKDVGVLIEEHLYWNEEITQVKKRPNLAIGISSKVQSNASFNKLKTSYRSLFEPHLQYGTPRGGQKNNGNIATLQKLQHCALRKIVFKKRIKSYIYKEYKKLKFVDIINLQNCLCMYQAQRCLKLTVYFLAFQARYRDNYKNR